MQHKKRKERREREGGLITHNVMRIKQTNIGKQSQSSEIALITLVEMLVKMQTEMWKTI
jgi:hypothetical protein